MSKKCHFLFVFFIFIFNVNVTAQYKIDKFDNNWKNLFSFPADGYTYNEDIGGIVYEYKNRTGISIFLESNVFDSAQWKINFTFENMQSGNGFARYYVASSSKILQSSHAIFVECIAHDNTIKLCEQLSDGSIIEIIQSSPIAISDNGHNHLSIDIQRLCNGEWELRYQLNDGNITKKTATHSSKIDAKYSGIRIRMDQNYPSLIAINSMSAVGVKICNGKDNEDNRDPNIQTNNKLHSIVFTEIMADPDPSAGLPNVEYIEIYNRSDSAIDLSNYKLYVGNSFGTLYSFVLDPHTYAFLCSDNNIDQMVDFEGMLPVKSFKALINSGQTISLYNPSDNLITWLEYSSDWYKGDVFKSNGGYSLERKDVNNLHISDYNFIPSISEKGGTPGRQNSVNTIYPDTIIPKIIWSAMINKDSIKIAFNKEMCFNLTQFNSSDIDINQIYINQPYSNIISIPIENNEQDAMSLQIENLRCISGLEFADTLIYFHKTQTPQPCDIMINELMYNPNKNETKYIEIFNASEKYIDLSTLWITKQSSNEEYASPQRLTSLPKMLAPDAYAIIAKNFNSLNNVCENAIQCTIKTDILSVSGGKIVLTLQSGKIIDYLSYKDELHNPWVKNKQGVALEKIDPYSTIFSPDNWTSAASTHNFSTPGCTNSQIKNENVSNNNTSKPFYLEHEAFTPNNDAWQDKLIINYELQNAGFICSINIYSPSGNFITNLIDDIILPSQGQITWDATTSMGNILPVGIYVLIINAIHPNGERINQRLVAVIAS